MWKEESGCCRKKSVGCGRERGGRVEEKRGRRVEESGCCLREYIVWRGSGSGILSVNFAPRTRRILVLLLWWSHGNVMITHLLAQ